MTTKDDVRAFILDELVFAGSSDDLTDDYPLLERAVLDSNGLMQLVTFLEEHCSIMIDDEDLVPDNFGTIEGISAFVDTKRTG
jgi:acyl carrier protein